MGQLYKTAMRDSRSVALEHRYDFPDGRYSWLDMRAYPIEGGGLAIFFRDVTERRASELGHRESEARFRAAIDATDGILWTNDAEGRMVGEQPGWARLTGQTMAEYQGYGWATAVHPDDAQPTIIAWNAAVSSRQPFIFEHRLKRHDGAWRRFAIRAIPVADDAGEIREWVGVHHDITEATDTRVQLAGNAATFESLVRGNPFGIYVVDNALRVMEVSAGAAKAFRNVDPLIGRDIGEALRVLWPEPFVSQAITQFRQTLETGVPYVSHGMIETRADIDATEAHDWRIERIALPDGSDGVVCYFYDLSDRMKLEEELRQALADKELLTREVEHRVQNSLTIVGSLLMLQRTSAVTTETKNALAAASSRVLAIGEVHRRLHQNQNVGNGRIWRVSAAAL